MTLHDNLSPQSTRHPHRRFVRHGRVRRVCQCVVYGNVERVRRVSLRQWMRFWQVFHHGSFPRRIVNTQPTTTSHQNKQRTLCTEQVFFPVLSAFSLALLQSRSYPREVLKVPWKSSFKRQEEEGLCYKCKTTCKLFMIVWFVAWVNVVVGFVCPFSCKFEGRVG